MLTEQQRIDLSKQIADCNTKADALISQRRKIEESVEASFSQWLKKRFSKLTAKYTMQLRLSHDFGDWNEKTQDFERTNSISIYINNIGQDSSYPDITVKVDDGKVTYSTMSFFLDNKHPYDKVRLDMFKSLVNAEEQLSHMFDEELAEDKELFNQCKALHSSRNKFQTLLDNDEYLKNKAKAEEQISVGAIFKDNNYDGWYLEVKKITNKLIVCNTACEWTWHSEKKQNVAWRKGSRQIKKEDFITRVMNGSYNTATDVELKGE